MGDTACPFAATPAAPLPRPTPPAHDRRRRRPSHRLASSRRCRRGSRCPHACPARPAPVRALGLPWGAMHAHRGPRLHPPLVSWSQPSPPGRAPRLNILDRRVEVRTGRMAVRMRRPRARVPAAGQTVVEGRAQRPPGGVTHGMALRPPRLGHAAPTVTGPAPAAYRRR